MGVSIGAPASDLLADGIGPVLRGLIVDTFCGGIGGGSKGLRKGLGRMPHICINHDREAIRWHKVNHRSSRHIKSDVREVDPVKVCKGRPVFWAHFSPDCTYHSNAKGGKPIRFEERKIRALPWIILRWLARVRPQIISMENVVEILHWGPIRRFKPHQARKGQTWDKFVAAIRSLGYVIEWRKLKGEDFGEGTRRERLFAVARCDGLPIVWPKPTHGTKRRPVSPASDHIDFTRPCPSIFMDPQEARALGLKRPLADGTLERIAHGVVRLVLDDPRPFVFTIDHRGAGPNVAKSIDDPLSTVTTKARHCLVVPFLSKYFTGDKGHPVTKPLGAITCWDHHAVICATTVPMDTDIGNGERVAAFLMQYYGHGGQWSRLDRPLPTIVTKARHALVVCTLHGEQRILSDIGMRMLDPDELASAQGLKGYKLPANKAQAIEFIGNSLCPSVLAAICKANDPRPRRSLRGAA